MVAIGGYRTSDVATAALVDQTLHEHGIDWIGGLHGGWVDLNVQKRDATKARKLLIRLRKEGGRVAVAD
jgi:hypothetical protein